MISIAITGNMGVGKSTVCDIFEAFGIPVYYADIEAKKLVQNNSVLRQQIQQEFGEDVYRKGVLQPKVLAARAFHDPQAVSRLNALVHPAVFTHFEQWKKQQLLKGHPLVLEEAALTFEAGHEAAFDAVICVIAPVDIIYRRVMTRDSISRKEVDERLSNQWPQQKKALAADGIILNDGDHSLIFQVQNLLERWELPVSQLNTE